MFSMQRNQCRNFRVAEVNRRKGSGTREKVSSRRINLECNTFVHGSNARNLLVQLPLSQLAKMLCPSYYCSYSLFNKIRDKGRTDSAWKQGSEREREGAGDGGGGRGREGARGRGKK
jgi:hypothetical protein